MSGTIVINKGNTLTVNKRSKTIEIKRVSVMVSTANYVEAGTPFYFDGDGGDTYLVKNISTNELELWVNGVRVKRWS